MEVFQQITCLLITHYLSFRLTLHANQERTLLPCFFDNSIPLGHVSRDFYAL